MITQHLLRTSILKLQKATSVSAISHYQYHHISLSLTPRKKYMILEARHSKSGPTRFLSETTS